MTMPGRKPADTTDRWLNSVLALRLRQIERSFPSYSAFAEKSGISRRTLALLRNGKGNPSFATLLTLAASYEVSVWSLLGIRAETVSSGVESYGFSTDEVENLLMHEHSNKLFRDDQEGQLPERYVSKIEPPDN
ncbi:helix-turn-helix transcriptional regulator [Bosea sp. AK1]|uniref:helix-turn-helix domain-containing protein n=1 Tax=Bosea sp. AK1 TaxID=2587160 RepID=UPI001151AA11|nr:helix-turn-helix transcriptional regulator [Bosea sp. AK1]